MFKKCQLIMCVHRGLGIPSIHLVCILPSGQHASPPIMHFAGGTALYGIQVTHVPSIHAVCLSPSGQHARPSGAHFAELFCSYVIQPQHDLSLFLHLFVVLSDIHSLFVVLLFYIILLQSCLIIKNYYFIFCPKRPQKLVLIHSLAFPCCDKHSF